MLQTLNETSFLLFNRSCVESSLTHNLRRSQYGILNGLILYFGLFLLVTVHRRVRVVEYQLVLFHHFENPACTLFSFLLFALFVLLVDLDFPTVIGVEGTLSALIRSSVSEVKLPNI